MRHSPVTRTVSALACVAAVVGGAAGCGSSSSSASSDPNAPVTITFWDNNGGPNRTPIYQELIKRFEAKNPKITVNYVGLPAKQAQQKYETAVAGGSVPDVGVINSDGGLSGLVAQKALAPLDTLYASSPLNGKIAKDALDASRATTQGKLYVMPATTNADVIWYNSTMLNKAGVKPPKTWSEFYSAAKTLTNASAGRYGFSLRGGSGGVPQLVADMVSCSAMTSFFDANGNSTLNTPANVECVKNFAGLYGTATSKADVNNAYPAMISEFDKGAAAMVQHNLGSAADHAKALGAGVAQAEVLPESDSTHTHTLLASATDGPAIFAGSTHQAADWKFVQFLLSHESNSYWNKIVGQIPTNTDARQDSWVKDAQQVSAAVTALSNPQTKTLAPPNYLPDWGSIADNLTPDYQSMLIGKTTPAAFLKKFADQVTASNKSYKKSIGK